MYRLHGLWRTAVPAGLMLCGPGAVVLSLGASGKKGQEENADAATTRSVPPQKPRKQWEPQSTHACTAAGKYVPGCEDIKIFSGRSHRALAAEVAELLGVSVGHAIVGQFADGETQIQVLEDTRGKDCYVIQSCIMPVNDRIMELLLFVSTLHRASAKNVTAVVPYYGYKHHYRPGPVAHDKKSRFLGSAAQDIAQMLEVVGVDRVIAVDLQRPGNITESTFFSVPVDMAMTDSLGIEYFASDPILANNRVTVVAPNPDTARKAAIFRHGLMDSFSDPSRVQLALFSRAPVVHGARIHTESELLGDVKGSYVILVDDLIDTANTLIRAAEVCKERGAKDVYVWASHGLFNDTALRKIEEDGNISKVVVSNTVPLPETYKGKKVMQLSIGPMLAKLIQQDHYRRHALNDEELVADPEEMR